MKKYIADIGGNGISWIIKEDSKIIVSDYFPTKGTVKDDVLKEIAARADEYSVDAVLLSSPGAVNTDTGELRGITGISGYNYFNLYDELRSFLKHKEVIIKATNDANAATLGTMLVNKDVNYALQVTIGTGIGGGIYKDGKVIFGPTGFGGEFGYMPVLNNERRMTHTASKVCSADGLVRMFEGKYNNARDIFENEWDSKKVEDWFYILGKFIFALKMCFDPEVIFLAGGVTNNAKFFDRLNTAIEEIVKRSGLNEEVLIKKSSSDDNVALLGAESLL